MDNVLLVGTELNHLTNLKSFLQHEFTIRDVGALKYFLEVQISRTEEDIFLS